MPNLDAWIIEFINGNWLALTFFLGLLKVVAKMTPWVGDDAIHTWLSGVFGMVKKPELQKRRPAGVPPLAERGDADIHG